MTRSLDWGKVTLKNHKTDINQQLNIFTNQAPNKQKRQRNIVKKPFLLAKKIWVSFMFFMRFSALKRNHGKSISTLVQSVGRDIMTHTEVLQGLAQTTIVIMWMRFLRPRENIQYNFYAKNTISWAGRAINAVSFFTRSLRLNFKSLVSRGAIHKYPKESERLLKMIETRHHTWGQLHF